MVPVYSGDRHDLEETTPGQYVIEISPIKNAMTATLTHAIMPQSYNNIVSGRNQIRIRITDSAAQIQTPQLTLVAGLYSEKELHTRITTWLDEVNATYGTDISLVWDSITGKESLVIAETTPPTSARLYPNRVAHGAQPTSQFAPIWFLLGFTGAQIDDKTMHVATTIEAVGKYNGGHNLAAMYVSCEELCNRRQMRTSSREMEKFAIVAIMPMDPSQSTLVFEPTEAQQLCFRLADKSGNGRDIRRLHIEILGRDNAGGVYIINFNRLEHHLTWVIGAPEE